MSGLETAVSGKSVESHRSHYLGEFRKNWQALAAACAGLIAGTSSIYLNNLFSPSLIEEFGWKKSDFALIGLTTVIAVIFLPVAGRLADRYGLRRVAIFGVAGLPLVFCGLALQTGGFALFFLLSTLQMLIVSSLGGIIIYGRLVVRYFSVARGLALGISTCMPAVATVVLSPLLGRFISEEGWRAGYFLMAAIAAVLGAIALLAVPKSFSDRDTRLPEQRSVRRDYGELVKTRQFLVIFGAMLLCNVHFTMQTTQLTIIVSEMGIDAATASAMISIFAVGVIFGRICCGIALDRYQPRYVAVVCFLFPAAGLAILAAGSGNVMLVGLGVMSLGFSVGAEGDVAAYLATRYFRQELFSSVLSLFTSAMAISALVGAILLSRTVAATGGYSLFLGMSAASIFLGALSFLLLGGGKSSDNTDVRET